MKQTYKKMQESLLPSKEKQEELWEAIQKKANEKEQKHRIHFSVKFAGGIAAAIIACAFCLPQTGIAASMTRFFMTSFSKNAEIELDIQHNIYEVTDGHVKMQIQDMLTDGACVYLAICYEALDEEGKIWLSLQDFEGAQSIKFEITQDYIKQTTGWSEGLREQKSLATDDKRYITYEFEDFSGNFILTDMTQILLFPMCQNQGRAEIKLSCNLETVSYRLVGDKSPSDWYIPKYLSASKLSYTIWGSSQNKDEYIRYISTWEPIPDPPTIIFTTKDGREVCGSTLSGDMLPEYLAIDVLDYIVSGGHFENENSTATQGPDGLQFNNITINPDELIGLTIDGVYYDLVQESLPTNH